MSSRRGPNPKIQAPAQNISRSERARRLQQSQRDKARTLLIGARQPQRRQRVRPLSQLGQMLPPRLTISRQGNRRGAQGRQSSAPYSALGPSQRLSGWKLYSPEPTRLHEVFGRKILTMTNANIDGTGYAAATLQNGEIGHEDLIVVHGMFRASNITHIKGSAPGHYKLGDLVTAKGNYNDYQNWGNDPDKYGTGLANTRYRITQAYVTMRVTCAPGTAGEIIMKHKTTKLSGCTQTGNQGYTLTALNSQMLSEVHSVRRMGICNSKAPDPCSWQRTWAMPLANIEAYGAFSTTLKPKLTFDEDHDCFGGFIIKFEGVRYSHHVTPPSITLVVNTFVEEELDFHNDDLQCSTKQCSKMDALKLVESNGGLKSERDTSAYGAKGVNAMPMVKGKHGSKPSNLV